MTFSACSLTPCSINVYTQCSDEKKYFKQKAPASPTPQRDKAQQLSRGSEHKAVTRPSRPARSTCLHLAGQMRTLGVVTLHGTVMQVVVEVVTGLEQRKVLFQGIKLSCKPYGACSKPYGACRKP